MLTKDKRPRRWWPVSAAQSPAVLSAGADLKWRVVVVVVVGRTVHVRPPMTSAGTANTRTLRSAVMDALLMAPDHLVIDLTGFRASSELREAVQDIRESAQQRHTDLTVAT